MTPTYKWEYHPQEKQGYLKLKEGVVHDTTPLIEGKLMIDKNKKGEIIGIEYIG